MTGKKILTPLAVCLALLLAADAATAWHLPDETENVLFASPAGDPRYAADTEACREAGSICVALYPHSRDLLSPAPLNVQRPPDCVSDLAGGVTGTPGIEMFWPFNHIVAHPSPGFVEYDPQDCDGLRRVHAERGLPSDLHVSPHTDVTGHWFMSADTLEFSPIGLDGHDYGLDFGAMPCLSVRMVLQMGRFPGQGLVLAEGTTTKTVVSVPTGTDPVGTPVPDVCPGATETITLEEVTEFRVNLGRIEAPIPAAAGFHVQVQWYQHDGGDPDSGHTVVQREWNRHTGADYPNRVVLPVMSPIRVLETEFGEHGDHVHIGFHVLSEFGSYDLDTANARLALFDAAGQEVPLAHLGDPIVRYRIDHGEHFLPVEFHYLWDRDAEDLAPGGYRLAFTAPGWQHTAQAHAIIPFFVAAGGERPTPIIGALQEAPAPPVALLIAGLAVAMATLRRPGAAPTSRT